MGTKLQPNEKIIEPLELSFNDMFASSPLVKHTIESEGEEVDELNLAENEQETIIKVEEDVDFVTAVGADEKIMEIVVTTVEEEIRIPEVRKGILNDFDLLCTLGKGAFGKVIQVKNKTTQKIYALKIMRKDTVVSKRAVDYIKTERQVMKDNWHPFIIHLHCSFQTDGKLYLVMDYASGGPLWSHFKKENMFSEKEVRFYIAEIALAISHLHERGVVHRDLKPENILLDHLGHVKVTDFGLAKENVGGTDGAKSFCGTDEYIAPEIIQGKGYGKAVDWWSLGALMFDMLTGGPPFEAKNKKLLYQKICNEKVKFPTYLTKEAVHLMKGLLNRNPAQRLTAGENILKHNFFEGFSIKKLIKFQITPPIQPKLSDPITDVSNFSPTFTKLPAIDSPIGHRVCVSPTMFQGFSFTRTPTFFGSPLILESTQNISTQQPKSGAVV